MSGLMEAVQDANGTNKKLKRRMVSIVPVKDYSAKEIQNSGAASRILHMMELDSDLTTRFPFVKTMNE